MEITQDIYYIGVNDHEIDLFEGIYDVPNGMAYNSYVIVDEKIAVMDTTESKFTALWLQNLDKVLEGRTPDYLVVHHMEPDHSASIAQFMEKYPEAIVAASGAAFKMMKNFYGTDYPERHMVLTEKCVLELGSHSLRFFAAPMVHWPEVMVSYDTLTHTLFSADAFGKFGALDYDDPEGWACEARRYYFGIVGKFGTQVQALLKKLSDVDIQIICSLHGPVLKENIPWYVNLYNIWSSYGVESEGVAIFYTSVYGHTKQAVELLAEKLKEKGCAKVVVNDLARSDLAENVEDAFRYGTLVFASTTYNTGVFPIMRVFLENLTSRSFQNRRVALIENGSWAPGAAKAMQSMLEGCANLRYAKNSVRIMSALTESSAAQIEALAEELVHPENPD